VAEIQARDATFTGEALEAGIGNPIKVLNGVSKFVAGLIAAYYAGDWITKGKLTEKMPDSFQQVLALGKELLIGIGEKVVHGIEGTHVPMRATMGALTKVFFEEIDGELATFGQTEPGKVLDNAAQLCTLAASLGATAHLFSVAAESAHGAKHLGLNMFGAFLTNFAGFENIAKHSFGVQYEAALRSPSRRLANSRFRP